MLAAIASTEAMKTTREGAMTQNWIVELFEPESLSHLQTCVLWWYRKLAKRLSMARENQKRFVKTLVYVTPMGVDVDVWLIIHALIQKATVAVANLTTLQHAVNSFAVVPNLKMRVSLFEHSCRGLVV